MTVEHALTPMTGLIVPFLFMLLVYAVLFGMVTWLMLDQIRSLNERVDGKGGGQSGRPRLVSPTVKPAFGD